MEQAECFETSAYNIQTPEHYPQESIQELLFSETNHAVIAIFRGPLRQALKSTSIISPFPIVQPKIALSQISVFPLTN